MKRKFFISFLLSVISFTLAFFVGCHVKSNDEVYTVAFYNDNVLVTEQSVNSGDEIVFPDETPERSPDENFTYTFIGWSEDRESTEVVTPPVRAYRNMTFYAIYEAKEIVLPESAFTLTKNYLGQSIEEEYYKDDAISLKAPEAPSAFVFEGWFLDDNFENSVEDGAVMPAEDMEIYAKFSVDFDGVEISLSQNLVYGNANAATVTGLSEVEGLSYSFIWEDDTTLNTHSLINAGEYNLSVKVAASYSYGGKVVLTDSITLTKTAVVAKATLSATLAASATTLTYGEVPTISLSFSGFKYEDAENLVSYAFTYKKSGEIVTEAELSKLGAGTYTVTAEIAELANYEVTGLEPLTFTVNKKAISVAVVANSFTYGDDLAGNFTVAQTSFDKTEFAYEEDSSVLGEPTLVYTSNGAEYTLDRIFAVGDYSVTAVFGESANYDVTIEEANFAVAPKKFIVEKNVTTSRLENWSFAPKFEEGVAFVFNGTLVLDTTDVGEYVWNSENHNEHIAWDNNYKITLDGKDVTANFEMVYNVSVTLEASDFKFVAPNPGAFTYDGGIHTFPVEVDGFLYEQDADTQIKVEYSLNGTDYGTEVPEFTNAGEYTVYYRISAANYNTKEGEFKVVGNKAQGRITLGDIVTEYAYTGYEQTVDLTGVTKDGDGELTFSKHTFTDVAEGDGLVITVTLTEGENYLGAEEKITLSVAKASYTVSGAEDQRYDYTAKAQGNDVTVAGVRSEDLTEYLKIGAYTFIDANTYTVTYSVTGNNNYKDIENETYTIEIVPVAYSFVAPEGNNDYVYNGKAHGAEVIVYGIAGDEIGAISISYTVDETAGYQMINAGEYVISFTVNGNSNYIAISQSYTYTLTINKANYSVADVEDQVYTYNGEEQGQEISVNGVNGESFAVTYKGEYRYVNANEEGYVIEYSITGNTNYNNVEDSYKLIINRASVTINTDAISTSLVYNGSNQSVDLTQAVISAHESVIEYAASKGSVNNGVFTFKNVAEGDGVVLTITVPASGNYLEANAEVTLSVAKAEYAVKADDQLEYVYTAEAKGSDIIVTGVGGDIFAVTYSVDGSGASSNSVLGLKLINAGSYTVNYVVANNDNYNSNDDTAGSFKVDIAKADRSIDISGVKTTSYTYTGAEQTISLEGITLSDSEGKITTGGQSLTFKDVPASGKIVITINANETDNYKAAEPVEFTVTVNKAALSATVRLENSNLVYGNNPSASIAWTGFVGGEDQTVIANYSNAITYYRNGGETAYVAGTFYDAGIYKVTAVDLASVNYEIEVVDATLKIDKKDFNISAADIQSYLLEWTLSPKFMGADADIFRFHGTLTLDTKQEGTYIWNADTQSKEFVWSNNAPAITLIGDGADVTENFNFIYAVSVTLNQWEFSINAPTATELTYDGANHSFEITAATTNGATATIKYKTAEEAEYITTVPQFINRGEYTVYYEVSAVGYATVTGSFGVKIEQAENTITTELKDDEFTYRGEITTYSVEEATAKFGGEMTVSYTYNQSPVVGTPEFKNVGEYEIILTSAADDSGNANFTSTSITITIKIKKAQLTITATVDENSVYYGDGAPVYGVEYDGFVGGEGADNLGGEITVGSMYDITDSGNRGIGVYTVTASGATSANYELIYAPCTFEVVAKEVAVEWSTQTLTYNGEYQAPTAWIVPVYTDDEVELIVSGAAVNAGKHNATAQFKTENANYTLTGTAKEYVIDKAALESLSVSLSNWTYGGEASEPQITGNEENGEVAYLYTGLNYSNEIAPVNAGEYKLTITVASTDNYLSGTAECAFTIEKAKIVGSVTIVGWTYNAQANAPQIIINGKNVSADAQGITVEYVGVEGTNYEQGPTVPTDSGRYQVVVSVEDTYDSNYNGTMFNSATFEILKAELNLEVSIEGWTYGDDVNRPQIVGNEGLEVSYLYESTDGAGYSSADIPVDAGIYKLTITVAESANYKKAEAECAFTIKKATVSASISQNEFKYNRSNLFDTAKNAISVTSITANDFTVELKDATEMVNAAAYTLTIFLKDDIYKNYAFAEGSRTAEIDIAVAKAEVDATLLGRGTYTYDGQSHISTANFGEFADLVSGDYLIKYNGSTDVPVDVNEYTVTIESTNDNIIINYTSIVIAISKATITVTATVSQNAIEYGEEAPSISVTYSGFAVGDGESVVTTKAVYSTEYSVGSNVGEYKYGLTAEAQAANYTFNYVAKELSFSVRKAVILVTVSQNVNSIVYGETAPTANIEYSGLKGDDTDAVINNKSTLSTSYDQSVAAKRGVGVYGYILTQSETATNYDFTYDYANVTFEVVAKEVEVIWSDAKFTYTGEAQAPAASTTGVYGDDVTLIVTGAKIDAGKDYIATASLDNKNYILNNATKDFTIAKAKSGIITELENDEFVFDGLAHTYDPAATPKNFGEIVTTFTYNGAAVETPDFRDAGEYEIILTIADNDNWDGSEVVITITVLQAEYNVVYDTTIYTYNGNVQGKELVVRGVANDEDFESGAVTYVEGYAFKNADTYTVTYSVAATKNYKEKTGSYELVINKATYEANVEGKFTYTYNASAQGEDIFVEVTVCGGDENTYSVTYTGNGKEEQQSVLSLDIINYKEGGYKINYTVSGNDNYEDYEGNFTVIVEKGNYTIINNNDGREDSLVYNGGLLGNGLSVEANNNNETINADNYELLYVSYERVDSAVVKFARSIVTYDVVGTPVNSATAPRFINAGTYKVYYTVTDRTGNYNDVDSFYYVTIAKAELTVTEVSRSYTYNGEEQAFELTVMGVNGAIDISAENGYTLSYVAADNGKLGENSLPLSAGTYTVSVTLNGDVANNYFAVEDRSFSINKAALTVSGVTVTAKDYDGQLDANVSQGILNGAFAGDNVTYTVTGQYVSKNAGTEIDVMLTVELAADNSANNNYTISLENDTVQGDINKAQLTVSGITVEDKFYDGTTSATIDGVGTLSGNVVSGEIIEYTVTGAFVDANAGEGKPVIITITVNDEGMANNYDITPQAMPTATISKVSLEINGITAENKSYDGSNIATINDSNNGKLSTGIRDEVIEYTVAGTFDGVNAADNKTVTLNIVITTVDVAKNYEITLQKTTAANITKATLELPEIEKIYTYNGSGQIPDELAKIMGVAGQELTNGSDYSLSFNTTNGGNMGDELPVNAGEYTITVTLTGTAANNYKLANNTVSFDIEKYGLKVTYNGDKEYTGTVQDLSTVLTLEGLNGELTYGEDYELGNADVPALAIKKVGAYTLLINLLNDISTNYTVKDSDFISDYKFTFRIIPVALELPVITESYTYNGKEHEPTELEDDIQGVGEMLYKDSHYTLSYSTVNGSLNDSGIPVGAGEYTVIVTLTGFAADNYKLAQNTVSFTIEKAAVTIGGITANNKPYDGTTEATVSPASGVVEGVNGEKIEYTVTGAFEDANVADGKTVNLTITITNEDIAKNYNITKQEVATADITRAKITVRGNYTASKIYDGEIFSEIIDVQTARERGLIIEASNGEISASFSIKISTKSANASANGYTLAAKTVEVEYSEDNYEVTVEESTAFSVTIEKATITVSGTYEDEKEYNGAIYSKQPTVEEAKNAGLEFAINNGSDKLPALAITVTTIETNASVDAYVGTGTIDFVNSADSDNYVIVNKALYLIAINKANFDLKVDIAGWAYGEDANAPTVSGNVSGGEVSYWYEGETNAGEPYNSANAPTSAGAYTVTATVAETANYNVCSASCEFTIKKADYNEDDIQEIEIVQQIMGFNEDGSAKTLNSISLADGWSWNDDGELILVGENTYAIFYNADPDNYNNYETSITFTAIRKEVKVTILNAYEANFNDLNREGVDAKAEYIKNVATFTDTAGNMLSQFESQYLTLGLTGVDFAVGSTYIVSYTDCGYVTLGGINGADYFELPKEIADTTLFKLKSVEAVGAYFTIEDALNIATSGTITVKYDTSFAESIVAEKAGYSGISTYYTVRTGVTLLLPYDGASGVNTTNRSYSSSSFGNSDLRKIELTLPSKISITNNGTITIGGITTGGNGGSANAGATTGDYAQVTLGADAKIESYGNINVYGYIVEESYNNGAEVNMHSGTLLMPFIVVDHRGGSVFYGIYKDMKGSPFNRFFMHNVTPQLTIYSTASLIGYANLYANNQDNVTQIALVGSGSANLIQLANGAKLISKLTAEKFATSNAQSPTNLNIYGNMTLNNLALKVDTGVGAVSLSTEKVLFPISWYWNITLNPYENGNTAIVDATNQDIKIMQGSSLTISKGVTVNAGKIAVYYGSYTNNNTVGSGPYDAGKGDGILKVNGTLNVEYLGGAVQSDENLAMLKVSKSVSVTSYEPKSKSGSSFLTSVEWDDPIFDLQLNGVESPTQSTYYYDGDNEIWVAEDTTFNVSYQYMYRDGAGELHLIGAPDLINDNSGNPVEIAPKDGIIWLYSNDVVYNSEEYTFTGWYADVDCKVSVYSINGLEMRNITIYGLFEQVNVYNFTFDTNYNTLDESNTVHEGGSSGITVNDSPVTQARLNDEGFFPGSQIMAQDNDISMSRYFVGWYLNHNGQWYPYSAENVVQLYGELVDGDIEVKLYAVWANKIKVTFVDGTVGYNYFAGYYKAGDTVEPSNYNNGNRDISISTYFVEWRIDANVESGYVNSFTIPKDTEDGKEITLYAYRLDKVHVIFIDSNRDHTSDGYYMVGDIAMPSTAYDDGNYDDSTRTYLIEWRIDLGVETGYVNSFTIPEGTEDGKEITLYAYRADKVLVSLEDSVRGYTGEKYFMPNATVAPLDYNSGNDNASVNTYFIEWRINEEESNSNKVPADTPNGAKISMKAYREDKIEVKVTSDATKDRNYLKITVTGIAPDGSDTVWLNESTTYSASGYFIPGTTLTISLTYEPSAEGLAGMGAHAGYEKGWVNVTGAAQSVATGESVSYALGDEAFTFTFGATYMEKPSCLVEGTLIMLADGTQKPVEDLTFEDEVLVFNHETGKYEVGKLWFMDHTNQKASMQTIVNLEFADGTLIRIVTNHGFFDRDLGKYVFLDAENAFDYIGHRFSSVEYVNGEFVNKTVTLINVIVTEEEVRVFSPFSEAHMNMVTEGLLSMGSFLYGDDGFVNIFEFDEDMKWNADKMQTDIETYGLFTYEEFAQYMTYEDFLKTPAKWLKVALGKGLITWDDIENTIAFLMGGGFMY